MQCLNFEKLAGGWTFRQSESDQNFDQNCTYIQGAAKKVAPKFFRCFLSNRLKF